MTALLLALIRITGFYQRLEAYLKQGPDRKMRVHPKSILRRGVRKIGVVLEVYYIYYIDNLCDGHTEQILRNIMW